MAGAAAASSFLFHEQSLARPVALSALLSAWSELLSRHRLLCTVLHEGSSPPQQCVLDAAAGLQLSDLFVPLKDAGPVRDLTSLQASLAEAAGKRASLPPVRLLAGPRLGGGVVVLAVSRLLADRYTVRHVAAELMALYMERLPGGAPSPPACCLRARAASFLDQLSEGEAAAASVDQTQAAIQPAPLRLRGLRQASERLPQAEQQPLRASLPSALVEDVSAFAAAEGVSVACVLLASFLLTLQESEGPGRLSVVTELDRSHGALGPLSGPTHLVVERLAAEQQLLEAEFVKQVEAKVRAYSLSEGGRAALPGELEGEGGAGVPAFVFEDQRGAEAPGAAGGQPWPESAVVGSLSLPGSIDHMAAAPLLLKIEVRRDETGTSEFSMLLRPGEDYSMDPEDLRSIADRVITHAAHCSARRGARGKRTGRPLPLPAATEKQPQKPRGIVAPLPFLVTAVLQFMGIGVMGWAVTLPLLLLWPAIELGLTHLGLYATIACLPGLTHVVGMLYCLEVVLLRALLPLPPAGSYAVHSWAHLRWWFHSRLVSFLEPAYVSHLQGTLVHTCWLRALGARVGEGVRLAEGVKLTDPDLVTLGDGAALGQAVRLVGSVVRGGQLMRGPVEVGPECRLRTHAMMLPNSRLGQGVRLEAGAVVQPGQALLAGGGVYAGSPAAFVRPAVPGSGGAVAVRAGLWHEVACTVLQGAVPLCLATLSSAIAWPLVARLTLVEGIFPFFDWVNWPQGRILFCLFSMLGFAPMLCFPLLLGYMTLSGFVLQFPEGMLAALAEQAGIKHVAGHTLKNLLMTEPGLKLFRSFLPKGARLVGQAGSPDLKLYGPGR